ncbi:PAS domain-containing sensor histidine kinase [Magnetospirillum sp. UT-4]|uniref:sensor histidine kinase n=1 Tax=Magnetospirillum sp. UT-4 TaxID=2681467 RepID=UPI001383FA4C|nr:PAS domain-containing sensor histidine kinase [Magnetospirillum sp. UT-4]CAA7613601.1 putative Histidine kinase [Magnetospirillum sp. UT-4]
MLGDGDRTSVEEVLGELRAVVFQARRTDDDVLAFTCVGGGCRALLGLEAGALLGDSERMLARVHVEDRSRLRSALFVAAVNGQPCDTEFRIRDGAAGWRWVQFTASPSAGGAGAGCTGLLVEFTRRMESDTTRARQMAARHVAEREASETQIARQKEIIALLHDIAAAANEAPNAETAMSRCLTRMCGHGGWPIGHVYRVEEELPGRLVPSDLWFLADSARFAEWDARTRDSALSAGQGLAGRVLASGEPEWLPDVEDSPDDPRIEVARALGLHTGFALPVRIGMEVVAVLEFFSPERIAPDPLLFQALTHIGLQIGRVVERDRATRQLKVVTELAQSANRAKSNFLANMSHELRTPLNAVIGFSEAMLAGLHGPLANPNYLEYAGYIRDAGHHLLDLVADILDLSAIEARRLTLKEGDVDIARLIATVVALARTEADSSGLTLVLECAPSLPAVHADERRLRQILLNLVANAIHATPAGGRVCLSAGTDGQHGLVLTVSDSGRGMSPELLASLFSAFDACGPAFSTREGIGLGLPLVKALVDLHGGNLDMKSEPGQGTTAIVRLPPSRLRIHEDRSARRR